MALGEAIFREQCSSCHEEDARGDDDGFVPSLRNQHYTYLLNETRRVARWHSRNLDPDLERFLASLDEDELIAASCRLSCRGSTVRSKIVTACATTAVWSIDKAPAMNQSTTSS